MLLKNPGAKSTELAALAQVSTPTMVRMLNEMEGDVLRLGKARGTRYFLRRSLRGLPASAPVFEVDSANNSSDTVRRRSDLLISEANLQELSRLMKLA